MAIIDGIVNLTGKRLRKYHGMHGGQEALEY